MACKLSSLDVAVMTGKLHIVSGEPVVRKQGNGNFTGAIKHTWNDGSVTYQEFIMNAKSVEAVKEAYFATRAA